MAIYGVNNDDASVIEVSSFYENVFRKIVTFAKPSSRFMHAP